MQRNFPVAPVLVLYTLCGTLTPSEDLLIQIFVLPIEALT